MRQAIVAFVDPSEEAVRAARFASSLARSTGADLVLVAPMETFPVPRPALIPRPVVEEIKLAADLDAWSAAGRTLDEIRRDRLVPDDAEGYPIRCVDDPIAPVDDLLGDRGCLLIVFPRKGPWTSRVARSTATWRSSLPVAVVP